MPSKLERIRLVVTLAQQAGLIEEGCHHQIETLLTSGRHISLAGLVRQNLLSVSLAKQLKTLMALLPEQTPNTSVTSGRAAPADNPRIGRYKIVRELGRGGMGVVYEAYDPSLDRHVALKTLLEGMGTVEKERFLREARLAASLHHPGIVPVYEIGCENDIHFFTMELVKGQAFDQALKEQRLSFHQRLEVLQKVAQALDYAHQQGVIHRDIKPGNILLDADENPKLTDFGLARPVDSDEQLTVSGVVLGTPSYMSPEQAMGKEGHVDHRSDIYSVGAILYEIFTARPPFTGSSLAECLQAIKNDEPVPPRRLEPALPCELEAICLKCLEKEPAKRYATAGALADDIGRYLKGEPVLARPIRWPARLWRKMKRHRALTLAIVGFIALVSLGLLGNLLYQRHEQRQRIRSLLQKAQTSYRADAYDRARELLAEALRIDQRNAEVQALLTRIDDEIQRMLANGKAEEGRQNWQAALAWYAKILQKDLTCNEASKRKEFVETKLEMERVYETLRKENELRRLERKRREQRARAMIPYEHALEVYHNPRLQRSDLLRCAATLSQAIEADPQFPEAYLQRGRVFHRLCYMRKAISDYQQCIQLNDKLYAPRYYLAKINPQAAWVQESVAKIAKIREPDKYQALFMALCLYQKQGAQSEDLLEALEICQGVKAHYPLFAEVHFLLARIYAALCCQPARTGVQLPTNLPEHAFEAVNQGLTLDPCNGEGYYQRARLHLSLAQAEQALQDLDRAIEFGFNNPQTYYQRVLAYWLLQRLPEARNTYQLLLRSWPQTSCGALQILLSVAQPHLAPQAQHLARLLPKLTSHSAVLPPQHPLFQLMSVMVDALQGKPPQTRQALQQAYKTLSATGVRPIIRQLRQQHLLQLPLLQAFADPWTAAPRYKPLLRKVFGVFLAHSHYRSTSLVAPVQVRLGYRLYQQLRQTPRLAVQLNQLTKSLGWEAHFDVFLLTYANLSQLQWEEYLLQKKSLASSRSYYRRALAFYRRKQLQAACDDLELALEFQSDNPQVYYARATLAACQHQLAQARFYLQCACDLDPRLVEMYAQDDDLRALRQGQQWRLRANSQRLRSFRLLKATVTRLLARKQGKKALYLINAYDQEEQKAVAAKIQAIEKAAFQDLCRTVVQAIAAEQDERVAKLMLQAKRLLSPTWQSKLKKELTKHYLKRGRSRLQSGQLNQARQDYERVLQLDPNNWQAHLQLGTLYYETKHYREAIFSWQEAQVLNPTLKEVQAKIKNARQKLSAHSSH